MDYEYKCMFGLLQFYWAWSQVYMFIQHPSTGVIQKLSKMLKKKKIFTTLDSKNLRPLFLEGKNGAPDGARDSIVSQMTYVRVWWAAKCLFVVLLPQLSHFI